MGRFQCGRNAAALGPASGDRGWFSVDAAQMTFWPVNALGRVKQGANMSMPLVGWRASVPKNGQLELRNAD